jgi:hypothetical protein
MTDHQTLIKLADHAFTTLLESLDGLTEEQSWATLQLQPEEYLHSEGSILSQIAHIANGKIIYASVGFKNTEVRWRELSPKIDSIWPSLTAVTEWLHESHNYWLDSWRNIADLETMRPKFDHTLMPTWHLIATGIHHDHYHAGQITMQRAILAPSSTPPPPEGDLWKKYCENYPCW